MTNFEGLNLIEPLLRNVEASGFTAPTEIQAKTIPALLEGRDLMGISQTGEGKKLWTPTQLNFPALKACWIPGSLVIIMPWESSMFETPRSIISSIICSPQVWRALFQHVEKANTF